MINNTKTRCNADVPTPGLNFYRPRKCQRAAVRDGYCIQHHPEAKAARQKKALEARQAKAAASPSATIARLAARVKELESEINRLRSAAEPSTPNTREEKQAKCVCDYNNDKHLCKLPFNPQQYMDDACANRDPLSPTLLCGHPRACHKGDTSNE